jgi:D-3-phosphoglycerate dehydrogenase
MSKWRIILTDGLQEEGKQLLNQAAEVEDRNGIPMDELQDIIDQYDAMIVRGRTKVTAAVLASASRLKVVGRAGVGVDNIDLAAAQAQGVMVVNSPMATTIAVAEHTLALMLSLVRDVPRADAAMKSGLWIKKQLSGTEINGKILGIIGLGRIGAAVAERARGFGMRILGYDPFLPANEIQRRGAEPVSIAEIFRLADFISLHLPLSPDTRNLIDGQAIAQMKPGVRILCAARGGIIDETALLAGLESGQVAGAALDVFAEEPPGLSALVAHPRVVATPHIGAETKEAQIRAAQDIASEVLAALRGEPLRWKIV